MAQHVVRTLVDDLDGKTEAAETVRFELDRASFEIDLCPRNATRLRKFLDSYIKHGRRVGGRHHRAATSPRGRSRSLGVEYLDSAGTRVTAHNDEIGSLAYAPQVRAWARKKRLPVSDRGRMANQVIEAYLMSTQKSRR